MLTKIEELREQQGVSTARKVFDMEDEAEATHYVRELFKAHVKRAELDAANVIRLIETKHAKGFAKNAIAAYRNRVGLLGLFRQYGVLESLRTYSADIVQAHFAARERCAGLDVSKWFKFEESSEDV